MNISNKQPVNQTQDLFTEITADALVSLEIADADKMTKGEMRATSSLAAIYGLRMFGMFSILPIFAIYASTLSE